MSPSDLLSESDQAAALRRRVETPGAGHRTATPWIVVVTGRSGDGASRVGRELAQALTDRGLSIGWVAAATASSGAAPGDDPIPVPFATNHGDRARSGTLRGDRVESLVRSTARRWDRVVIDLGTARGDRAATVWQMASEIVLVCRPEVESLTAVYGAAKHWMRVAGRAPISLVINGARTIDEAARFAARFDESCRRFLRQPNEYLGHLPYDSIDSGPSPSTRLASTRLAERLESRWCRVSESKTETDTSEHSAQVRAAASLQGASAAQSSGVRSRKMIEKSSIATASTTDRFGRVT